MDVGEISSIELGVRNQEEKWFVKYLEVHLPLKAKTHVFEINNWFCRTEGDGLLVRKFDISGKNFNPNFKPNSLSNIENYFLSRAYKTTFDFQMQNQWLQSKPKPHMKLPFLPVMRLVPV